MKEIGKKPPIVKKDQPKIKSEKTETGKPFTYPEESFVTQNINRVSRTGTGIKTNSKYNSGGESD